LRKQHDEAGIDTLPILRNLLSRRNQSRTSLPWGCYFVVEATQGGNRNAWGIDACRSGWIAAGPEGRWLHDSHLLRLLEQTGAETVLIDMPIGLSGEKADRNAEAAARKILGRKASSVFTPPCRKAVYATDYREACALQEAYNGKRISIQAWNIVPRICELDQLLQAQTVWRKRLFESHPELNFCILNGGQPIMESKKTAAGKVQRLRVLQSFLPGAEEVFLAGRRAFLKRQVQDDDLLDALCLKVVSGMNHAWLQSLAQEDEFGLGTGFRVPVPA
jgi:predicted RNase H-like nuclease